MRKSIDKEMIGKVIDDSTWVSNERNTVFEFSNGKDLAINGENHKRYALMRKDGKVAIKLADQSYFIDYINDFALHLYNDCDAFSITPE